MVAIGQRHGVVVLVGLDRAALRQVRRRSNRQNRRAVGSGELWVEESECLVNLLNSRYLSLAASGATAEEYEEFRVVETDFVNHPLADRPRPAAADLLRKLRVVIHPTRDTRPDADRGRFLPEIPTPQAMFAAQVGVAAPRVFI